MIFVNGRSQMFYRIIPKNPIILKRDSIYKIKSWFCKYGTKVIYDVIEIYPATKANLESKNALTC